MTSKPPAQDLLDVVREFMERDLLPSLSGERAPTPEFTAEAPLNVNLWFQCKVAINILAIVRRELELRQSLEFAQQQRLIDLLGERGLLGEGELPGRAGSLLAAESRPGTPGDAGSLDALNRILCASIRKGEIGDDSADLIRHLRATITEALTINNPKWIHQPE